MTDYLYRQLSADEDYIENMKRCLRSCEVQSDISTHPRTSSVIFRVLAAHASRLPYDEEQKTHYISCINRPPRSDMGFGLYTSSDMEEYRAKEGFSEGEPIISNDGEGQ